MKLEKTKYACLVENNDRYFLGLGTKQKEVDILKYEKVGYILSSQERIDKVVEDEDPIVKELEKINSSYTAPSSFINNSISSAMAMIDLLYFISGDIEKINSLNKRIGINNTTFEKQFINIQVKETCKCQN